MRGAREPGFFATEIAEDIMYVPSCVVDTFENIQDLDTFCPAGPGALQDLGFLTGIDSISHSDANVLIRALLKVTKKSWHHAVEQRLHDI